MGLLKDNWSTEEYQSSASFVPKLATKVVQWLDVRPNDHILDIGCGDGILNQQFANILKRGDGSQLGLDSSPAMINAAMKRCPGLESSFQVFDCSDLSRPLDRKFSKIFSNAALHWILTPENSSPFFTALSTSLIAPNGLLVFEMGGLGNIAEMRTAIIMAVARHVGIDKARAADPWFFPDEKWVRDHLRPREDGRGWQVLEVERGMRTTAVDEKGVEGWVRLMGKGIFEVVVEEKREEVIKEVVEVLRHICRRPGGGDDVIQYVRLRCKARWVA